MPSASLVVAGTLSRIPYPCASHPLDDRGDAHAAADAHAHQRALQVAPFQLVDHGGDQASRRWRPGDAPWRWPRRPRSASRPARPGRFCRRSTTEAKASLISTRSMSSMVRPALGQRLLRGRPRPGQHDGRLGRRSGRSRRTRARGSSPRSLPAWLVANHDQRGAVDDARGIAGRVHVVDALDISAYLANAICVIAELPPIFSKAGPAGRPASACRCPALMKSSFSRIVRPFSSLDRHDRAVEPALSLGMGGLLLATAWRPGRHRPGSSPPCVAIRSAPMPCGHEAGWRGWSRDLRRTGRHPSRSARATWIS